VESVVEPGHETFFVLAKIDVADPKFLKAERFAPGFNPPRESGEIALVEAGGAPRRLAPVCGLGLLLQRYNQSMDENQPTAFSGRLYTADQVRHLDQAAIEGHGIAGQELMERAGRAAFTAIRERFSEQRKWLVVCGAGNNGGDGYVIARLAREAGIDCRLCALKSPDSLSGDAASAAQRWIDRGGNAELGPPRNVSDCDLIVDALLGTGLDRPAEGEYAAAISTINVSAARVAAVDIPSGLNSDTGRAMGGIAVEAELTVTFIGLKRGLFTADGPDHAGKVQFAGLGVPRAAYETVNDSGILIQENIILFHLAARRKNSHKGDYGWLLGLGGDRGMSGALRLCGEAALRSGAGKVTLLTHPDHAAVVNAGRAELMVRGVAGGDEAAEALADADVLVLGTGLGRSDWSKSLLEACRGIGKPMVLDADALNWLAEAGDVDDFIKTGSAVLTPHPAEAGRLLGLSAAEVQQDRVSAAQALADKSGAVVVLKGCGTVVSEPDGRYAICPLGNPGMASAGTGDVLSGVIGAMLAQGLDAWAAATVGVVAHAAAGDRAASEIGERGLIASDLIERLPAVLNPR